MILQIITFIFSVFWYTVVLVIGLIAALFVYLMVYFLKAGNSFPDKRRMCTSTRKLTGQTALVTGEMQISCSLFHDSCISKLTL